MHPDYAEHVADLDRRSDEDMDGGSADNRFLVIVSPETFNILDQLVS